MSAEPKYFIQDTRQHVGNAMLWWKRNGSGYCCDPRAAEIFTRDEARSVCLTVDHFRAWPVPYIMDRFSVYIDMQSCETEHSRLTEDLADERRAGR